MRGGKGNLATNRRLRLVEYAVATHLVSRDDLFLLERNDQENAAVTAPDCEAAQKLVDAVGQDFVDRAMKLGVDFDVETNHGVKDGAILQ